MTSSTAPFKAAMTKSSPKLLACLAIILSGVLLTLMVFSHRGLYQIYRSRQEQLRLDQENARLTEENGRLSRTIDRLQHDPEMIQDVIHRELNFVKRNEIIIQLPPGPRRPSATSSPAREPPKADPSAEAGASLDQHPRSWGNLEGAPKIRPKTR